MSGAIAHHCFHPQRVDVPQGGFWRDQIDWCDTQLLGQLEEVIYACNEFTPQPTVKDGVADQKPLRKCARIAGCESVDQPPQVFSKSGSHPAFRQLRSCFQQPAQGGCYPGRVTHLLLIIGMM
jgi:hypothetical protein